MCSKRKEIDLQIGHKIYWLSFKEEININSKSSATFQDTRDISEKEDIYNSSIIKKRKVYNDNNNFIIIEKKR